MRATPATARRRIARQHQPPCWKLRSDGLVWLASATPEGRPVEPAPDFTDIAIAIGMSLSSVYRIQEDPDWPLANAKTVAMATSAAKSWGIPYMVAFHRIFRDPTIPDESDDNWFGSAVTPDELITAFVAHTQGYARPRRRSKARAA